ncbi:MAG: hypothetical protein KDD73_15495 [Anaerolineales bacterium]|nr:hypothetical protein [Anaerolineales bacterium]
MADRHRWWQRVRELLMLVGLLALYGVGLPALFVLFGKGEAWPWLLPMHHAAHYLFVALLLLFVVGLGHHWRQMRSQPNRFATRLAAEGVTYLLLPDRELLPPRHPAARTDGDLWAELGELLPKGQHLAVELVKQESAVGFALHGLPEAARAAVTQIMAHWPGTQVRQLPLDELPMFAQGDAAWWCVIRPSSKQRPIQPAVQDPCLALLSEVARLPQGIKGGVQLLARRDPYSGPTLERQSIHKSVPVLNMLNKRYELYRQPWEVGIVDQTHRRDIEEWADRASRDFLDVHLMVWAKAPSEVQAQRHARQLAQTIIAQYGPSNLLKLHKEGADLPPKHRFTAFEGGSWTDRELGSLLHLVGRDGVAVAPTLRCATAKILPPAAANLLSPGVLLLAQRSVYPSTEIPIS